MANFRIPTKKILSEQNISKIIMTVIGLRDEMEDISKELIEEYDSSKTYVPNMACYYNDYLYRCLFTTTGEFDINSWKKVGDSLELVNKAQVEAMLGLTQEEIETLQKIINDSQITLSTTYSSSKIFSDMQDILSQSKKFTLEEFAKANKASYTVTDSVDTMTDQSTIYLLKNDTTYDMYIVQVDGTPTKIGDVNIDLTQFYTKTEIDNDFVKKTDADGKYATITTVDGKVDKTSILSAISSTPSDDKLLSEKAINDTLVKKTDIVTTIDNTVTDEQIASARAVLNSKSAIRMNESINPENYEVGAWFAEGHDSILLSTSDGHPCSEWHIGYVVTGFEMNDSEGYKIILAIAMSGNCYIKVQQWNTWTKWQRLCATSVADVGVTNIAPSDTTTFIDFKGNSSCNYYVKNGVCYVSLWGVKIASTGESKQTGVFLPKSANGRAGTLMTGNGDATAHAFAFIIDNGELYFDVKDANIQLYGSFSYPVKNS